MEEGATPTRTTPEQDRGPTASSWGTTQTRQRQLPLRAPPYCHPAQVRFDGSGRFFSLSFFTTPSVRPGPPGSYYGRSGPGPWPPPVTYLSPRRPLLCLCSGGAYGNLSKATGEVVLNGVLCTSLVTDLAWSIAGHRAGVWAVCGHHRGSGLLRGRRLAWGTLPMGVASALSP